jgi:CubicO group peptidase (beta-lactamase class C family)
LESATAGSYTPARVSRHSPSPVLIAALAVALWLTALPAAAQRPFPTDHWPSATPESQGLDSSVLADMLEHVESRALPVHSILIVRHGRIVLDASVYPFAGTGLHDIASATKSVTSLLIGIAIDKGYIKSVQEPVAGLLSLDGTAQSDRRRARMTVEHLLTMTSGLECGIEPGERELAAMRRQDDWAAFAFGLPMSAEPGRRYAYCSCNNHLLSAIISARTGTSALAFARKHLFAPLGIKDAVWPGDPKGRTHGWGDLRLHPRDFAKLAYLYLHRGRWNGTQVVSEAWVRQSTTPHITVRDGVGYGYSWWINTTRQPAIFEATGRGGQRAAVLPDKDLVVVFNGGGVNTDEIAPFLMKAIRSDAPLPDDAAAARRLRTRLDQARRPRVSPPPARTDVGSPTVARAISGRRYAIDPNPLDLRHLALAFSAPNEVRATLSLFGAEYRVPVGVDGRYRFSSTGPAGLPMAARGYWASATEFVLDLDTVANINRFMIRIQFEDQQLRLRIDEATGEVRDLVAHGRAESSVRLR